MQEYIYVARSEVRRMKILLLEHPRKIAPDRCNDIANTPLSSCLLSGYAAAMLQNSGFEVKIVEGFLDKLTYQDMGKIIEEYKPDLIGVHIVYHWQKNTELYNFLQQVKKIQKVSYITAYGYYPTIAFQEILTDCPAIDSVIVGELELTIVDLAKDLSAGNDCIAIQGIARMTKTGGLEFHSRELVEELDELPFPVRTEALYRIPEVNLLGSRGCYGSCTFCYINPFYGKGPHWRGRTPENIIAEIDQIIAETGTRRFYFTDPNFFGPGEKGQQRALRLAELLKSREIEFGIEGRVNDIHDETIAALVDAGLRHILIGLESGRDESLKRLNKRTTVAQNERALQILRKHGIEPNVGFIMFEPDSSLDDISANLAFLKRNDLLKNLPVTANVLYHHQIILKGTPGYRILAEKGRLEARSPLAYEGTTSFANPRVASLAEILRRVTNFLFNRMSGIWGGKVEEPENAVNRYLMVNGLLVDVFEENLNVLKSSQLTEEQIDSTVEDYTTRIDQVLTA